MSARMIGMRRYSCLLAILATAILALAGCEPKEMMGGQRRPHSYSMVVSLSPSTTEVLYAAGLHAGGLLGKTSSCDYPVGYQTAKIVVKGTEPDYEMIKGLEPEFVIYDKALYSEAKIAKFKEMGIETVAYGPKNLEEYEDSLVKLSQMFGTETKTSEYVDMVRSGIDILRGNVQDGDSIIFLSGDPVGGYLSMGTKVFHATLFASAGFEVKGPDSEVWAPVTVEQVMAWNPTYIVTPEKTAQATADDPKLAGVSAVKAKMILGVNADVLTRAGCRIDTFLADAATGIGRLRALRSR